ncbi:MAG TPA: phosphatase PAP2 family protein [Bacteroidales bacterium]|nr:phosphatase PAP2 family protein [Bacteroidales bacterium]
MENITKNYTLSLRAIITVIITSLVYVVLMAILVGLKPEHLFIVGIFNICFFLGSQTRRFILAFSIFIVYGVVYDLMRIYPNYLVNAVDIQGLFTLEKSLFGIHSGNAILTPNQYLELHHNSFLDVVAGLFYINWVPIPLAFAFYLYFKNKRQFLYFSLAFFMANIIGFCIYYIHPAAPPWYVAEYGFELHQNTPGSTAGLARFDALINLPVFSSIYSKNSNVFAAMPSLHCAYPVIVFYYGLRNKLGKINWFFGLFMAGIWFSAVYSGHHYIMDVIMGILCGLTAILILHYCLLRTKGFSRFLNKYEDTISTKQNIS